MGCAQSLPENAHGSRGEENYQSAAPGKSAAQNGKAGFRNGKTAPPAPATLTPAAQAAADARAPTTVDTTHFADEVERLTALRGCNVLDTPADPRFDEITKLVQTLFQTPAALVSLVDQDRLWFKSSQGPFGSCVDRQGSFCDMVLVPTRHEVTVVENAATDARFSANRFVVGPPGIRFYAGAPLVSSSGHRLGTLCVCDMKPRKVSAGLLNTLCNFAELVVREIERDKVLPLLQQQEKEDKTKKQQLQFAAVDTQKPASVPALGRAMLRHASSFRQGVVLIDTRKPEWGILYANESWAAVMAAGTEPQHLQGQSFWSLFKSAGGASDSARQAADAAVASGAPACLFLVHATSGRRHRICLRPAATDQIQTDVLVGIPNFVPVDDSDPRLRQDSLSPSNSGEGFGIGRSDSASSMFSATPFWFALVEGVAPNSTNSSSSGSTGLNSSSSSTLASLAISSNPTLKPLDVQGQTTPASLRGLKLGPLLGAGGFGRVYRATWQGALVAVKVVETYEPVVDSQGKAQGPLAEAVKSRKLRHPNIVQTFDFAAREQAVDMVHGLKTMHQVWMVQQFCNRGTLYDGIDRGWLRKERSLKGAPNPEAIYQTALEIASAVEYLHAQGICHGDLTGSNVLLNSSMRDARRFTALVTDFGLARAVAPPGSAVQRTETYGTVSHQPPELLSEGLLTPAVDIYAIGVLLWELWTSTRAFVGYNPARIIFLVTSGQADLQLPEDTPPEYKELCESCLHLDYMQRPSIKAVLSRLQHMSRARQE